MIFYAPPTKSFGGRLFCPPLAYWPPWPTGLMDPEWPKKTKIFAA